MHLKSLFMIPTPTLIDAGASLKPTTPGAITRAMSKKIQDLIRQATLAQELEHDLDPMASTLLACERVANPQHIQ